MLAPHFNATSTKHKLKNPATKTLQIHHIIKDKHNISSHKFILQGKCTPSLHRSPTTKHTTTMNITPTKQPYEHTQPCQETNAQVTSIPFRLPNPAPTKNTTPPTFLTGQNQHESSVQCLESQPPLDSQITYLHTDS